MAVLPQHRAESGNLPCQPFEHLRAAAQIGGEDRAKAIQLSMEYDPQPPFDSGHFSKASAATKASATALMSRELLKPAALKASTLLLWDQAIKKVRARL